MNRSSDSPGGFPFFLILVFLIFIIGASFLGHYNKEKKKSSWKRLAKANGLSFVEGDFFKSGYVAGDYRNHHLKLETIQKSHGKRSVTYTRIELLKGRHFLSKDQSDPQSMSHALNRFIAPNFLYSLEGEFQVEPGGRQFTWERREVTEDEMYLNYLFDLLSDLAEAYPLVVALGGEAVSDLRAAKDKQPVLQPVIHQLLRDIAQQTTHQLSYRLAHFLCARCLTLCGAHTIHLSWLEFITYYGCRICGQSRNLLEFTDYVVAVLDNQMSAEKLHQNGTLRINWLNRRTLFDFDMVEIIQATDEEVERFALQVGNDTDPIRQPKYKQMICTLAPACQLSENTVRILQRMFGQVKGE